MTKGDAVESTSLVSQALTLAQSIDGCREPSLSLLERKMELVEDTVALLSKDGAEVTKACMAAQQFLVDSEGRRRARP